MTDPTAGDPPVDDAPEAPVAEEPQRTRFVDPPPSDVPPAPPAPAPVAAPVASAPVDTASAAVERTLPEEAAPAAEEALVASAPVDIASAAVERTLPEEAAPAAEEAPVASVPVGTASAAVERTLPEEAAPAAEEAPVASVPVGTAPAAVERTLPEEAAPAAEEALVASAPVGTAPAAVERTLPEEPEQAAGDQPRPGSGLLIVAAVLLVAAIGGVGFWLYTLLQRGGSAFTEDGEPALRAAKAAVPVVLGYDYRTLDAGLAAAKKVTTDADGKDCPHKADPKDPKYDSKARCFLSEFTRTHDLVVKDFATRYKVVATADVSAAGIERVAGDEVTVLLYVNQQSTRSDRTSPLLTQARVQMVMQRTGDRWLVAEVTAL